jgi:hypothetical protein
LLKVLFRIRNEAMKGKYSWNEKKKKKKGEDLRSSMAITGYQQISRMKPYHSEISIFARFAGVRMV